MQSDCWGALGGAQRFGRLIGTIFRLQHSVTNSHYNVRRAYLERYKMCKSAEEVSAAQEAITEELERDYQDSRRDKGKHFQCLLSRRVLDH